MSLTQSQYQIELYELRLKSALLGIHVQISDNDYDPEQAHDTVMAAHDFINHQRTELAYLNKKYASALEEIERLNNIINQLKNH